LPAAASKNRPPELRAEFDRQIDTLVQLGYPQLVGMSPDVFVRRLAPLADPAAALTQGDDGRIPFVLMPGEGLFSRTQAVGRTEMNGHPGFTSTDDDDLKRFTPVADIEIPAGPYLLLDVDTGPDTLDVVPDEALTRIATAGRSPITIDEGLALVTQFPGILRTRNCSSMLASRCED
jgi:hypothetical protein